jgi:hypothetical protein
VSATVKRDPTREIRGEKVPGSVPLPEELFPLVPGEIPRQGEIFLLKLMVFSSSKSDHFLQ